MWLALIAASHYTAAPSIDAANLQRSVRSWQPWRGPRLDISPVPGCKLKSWS
jgi:hypothetical protein